MIAPYNAAAFHGLGAQSDAFDEDPMFPFPWEPPHYPGLFESAGYRMIWHHARRRSTFWNAWAHCVAGKARAAMETLLAKAPRPPDPTTAFDVEPQWPAL